MILTASVSKKFSRITLKTESISLLYKKPLSEESDFYKAQYLIAQ